MPNFRMIFKFILLVIFSIFEVLAVKNGQVFFFFNFWLDSASCVEWDTTLSAEAQCAKFGVIYNFYIGKT